MLKCVLPYSLGDMLYIFKLIKHIPDCIIREYINLYNQYTENVIPYSTFFRETFILANGPFC